MDPTPLFDYMRARHEIYLKRQAGVPKGQLTDDPIFQTFRFCNVFRELDTTTIWLRQNVREKVPVEHVLLATVLFRWFNRIKTGEAIFVQEALGLEEELPGETAWDAFVRLGNVDYLRAAIFSYCQPGPYVTGSYIIKTPDGMDKLDGVLDCVQKFHDLVKPFYARDINHGWNRATNEMLAGPGMFKLETVWEWLRQFPFLGDFMAYEIVTDLRHTPLLDKAPDIYKWANPGPGAMRGLNRMAGRDLTKRLPKKQYIDEMWALLEMGEDRELWPISWPELEMRDIEHSLCELDKYLRVKTGEGQPRQRFR